MDKINSFLAAFFKLEDSVIRNFNYNLVDNKIDLIIEAKDTYNKWKVLSITFKRIKEIKFTEVSTSNSVIYNSVYDYIDKLGYVFDLSPYDTESKCLEDYRKSEFYIICEDFEFTTD